MTAHLKAAAGLVPSSATASAAQDWGTAATKLMQLAAATRVQRLTALQQCEEQVEQTVQQAYQELQQQVNNSVVIFHTVCLDTMRTHRKATSSGFTRCLCKLLVGSRAQFSNMHLVIS